MHEQFYITPEEAVTIGIHVFHETLVQAFHISKEVIKQFQLVKGYGALVCAVFYRAGQVDGIRRERARRKARDDSAKLRLRPTPVELTATEEADAYRKLIIRLINGINGEKELRAILYLVRRCLNNEAGERQQTPVERLRNHIMHQLTWFKSEEGLNRISRYINRHWREDDAS